MKMFDEPRLCTCLAAAKSDEKSSVSGGKSAGEPSEMQQLLKLLTVLVEQNDQLISIAMQQPEDDGAVTGFGLDGLAINIR